MSHGQHRAGPSAPNEGSPAWRAAREIAYGSTAGIISKVFEHPFDLTKVRLQSQVLDASARFSGPIDCLTKTWRFEGIRGLYRGLPAPIVGAMAENASLFLCYDRFKNLIRKYAHQHPDTRLHLSQLCLAAAGAGAVTSFLLTPIELVKCKMQFQMLVDPVHRKGPLPGPISVFTSVIRSTGLRGLWLGHTGTFIRETGGTAAWFGTKEYVASLLIARRAPVHDDPDTPLPASHHTTELLPWESAVSGAVAGAAFNFALFPADTVKSAMQTEGELRKPTKPGQPVPPRATFLGTFKAMY